MRKSKDLFKIQETPAAGVMSVELSFQEEVCMLSVKSVVKSGTETIMLL